jgi:hypothetical protein
MNDLDWVGTASQLGERLAEAVGSSEDLLGQSSGLPTLKVACNLLSHPHLDNVHIEGESPMPLHKRILMMSMMFRPL